MPLSRCNKGLTFVFVGFISPVARGTSSPAHSQKGAAESAPHTPSGEKKEEKEDAGTPTSSAGAPMAAMKTGPPPRPRSVTHHDTRVSYLCRSTLTL